MARSSFRPPFGRHLFFLLLLLLAQQRHPHVAAASELNSDTQRHRLAAVDLELDSEPQQQQNRHAPEDSELNSHYHQRHHHAAANSELHGVHRHQHRQRELRPPRFMLDLYRRAKAGEQKTEGSVVRSFLPCNGRGKERVQFCVGPLSGGKILSAELHLRTKTGSSHRHDLPAIGTDISQLGNLSQIFRPEFRSILHLATNDKSGTESNMADRDGTEPSYSIDHVDIPLPLHMARSGGWKTFELTKSLGRHPQGNWKLDLRFETLEGELLKPRSILRLSSSPFLVLYVEDKNITSFQADFGPTNTYGLAPFDVADHEERQRRFKRYVEITADTTELQDNDIGSWEPPPSSQPPALSVTTAKIRRRKKKPDKKFSASPPHLPVDRRWGNEVLNFDDATEDGDDDYDDDDDDDDDVLTVDYEEDDLSETEAEKFRWSSQGGAGRDDEALLPMPRGYRQRGGQGGDQNRRRGKDKDRGSKAQRGRGGKRTEAGSKARSNKSRGQHLPSLWKSFENQGEMSGVEKTAGESCSLVSYTADLRAVGWGRRVISPRYYSANYCAGSCSFPLTQAESPTNHATVLSILALKQRQQQATTTSSSSSTIPPACCVPRKMDSLTVLFFDQDGSVVLKTYPQMSVISCGCR